MVAFPIGVPELALLVAFFAGFSLPLGTPPAQENPMMSHVAPERAVLYATWAASQSPNPNSKNRAERAVAEPEMQRFLKSAEATTGKLVAVLEGPLAEFLGTDQAEAVAELLRPLVKTLIARSTAVFVTRVAVEDARVVVEGGALIEAGDEAPTIAAAMIKAISVKTKGEEVAIGKNKFTRFAADGLIVNETTIGVVGPYVLLGVGKNSVEGMVERIRAKQSPEWLKRLRQRGAVERVSTVTYLDFALIKQAFTPLGGPMAEQIVSCLGLDGLGPLESVVGLDGEDIAAKTFLKLDGQPRGLLRLLDGSGLRFDELADVPNDSTGVLAVSFSPAVAYQTLRTELGKFDRNAVDELERSFDQANRTLGVDLREVLERAFGDQWVMRHSPMDGSLGGYALRCELKRPELVAELVDNLRTNLPKNPALNLRVLVAEGEPSDLYTLDGAGAMAPALALADDHAAISLMAQTLRAQAAAPATEKGRFVAFGQDKMFARPGRLLAFSWQDSATIFDYQYSLLPLAASAIPWFMGQSGVALPLAIDGTDLPASRAVRRHIRPSVMGVWRTDAGLEFESRWSTPAPSVSVTTAVITGATVALALPAVQAARTSARRTQSANNLRQISLAMLNFEATHKRLPAAFSVDKEGKPLLSWRVHLLPYIDGGKELYDEFHLDEPWDSDHNKMLIERIPSIYQSPNGDPPGMSPYLAVGGKSGVMPAPDEPAKAFTGVPLATVIDGTSFTVAFVEADRDAGQIWTKPDEFVPDLENPLKGLGAAWPGGFNVAMTDGSVRFISKSIDSKIFSRMLTRDEAVPVDAP